MTARGGRQTKEATMITSTHLVRITRLLVLGAVVAGAAASAVGAYDGRPPDVQDTATAHQTTAADPRADWLRWQGIAQVYGQQQRPAAPAQVLDAVRHSSPNQVGLAWQYLRDTGQIAGARDGSPPNLQEGTAALHTMPAGLRADGLRWQGIAQVYEQQQSVAAPAPRPDDRAGVRGVGEPTVVPASSGATFDWGDWSIGLVAGFGLALCLTGALFLTARRIPRVRNAVG
jgi:hypothetical protein